jgi:predicted RNA methylase
MLKHAQDQYDFYETPSHHSINIYNDYNPKYKVNVIDICCGLGSLCQPWYDNGHNITLVELNSNFIPILKDKYPKANILSIDFLTYNLIDEYDVYLCNPPFNTNSEKQIFIHFFCKILMHMKNENVLYFICPRMFYTNQMKVKIEYEILNNFDLLDYIKDNNDMPAHYYFNKYGVIELDSNGFRFNHAMLKRLKTKGIIDDDFISDEDFMINPYFEFRYLGNIFDFQHTKMKAGLFKVNK